MLNPIEEIKNRLDIVDVIRGYIKLKKAGANFQALCPFHSEKKPSFFVSPTRQIFKCFGCGASGDVFGFIKQIEGVEFGDALRLLAQKAGVELKPMRPEFAQWQTQRQRLYEVCEWACKFFETQLKKSNAGKQAQKYLLERGVSKESQVFWRLGCAPSAWQGLSDFLQTKGYKREEISSAGLAIRNEKGNFYDRFRGRIMFPIFDLQGQVIGFSGRVLPLTSDITAGVSEQEPESPRAGSDKDESKDNVGVAMAKYLNTPNTLLYDKGKILYGLDKAKVAIRKNNSCVLVEGNVDVILSHQAGITNVVATCGTALTPYQLRILKRYSENLILAFDMDVAGDTATKRGIGLAQENGFDIRVAILPQEKDPADVISQDPNHWKKILTQAKSILDFYFENAFLKFDKQTPQGKKEISRLLLPVLKRIPNKIIRFHWIQKLAGELEAREQDILDELEKIDTQSEEQERQSTNLSQPKSNQQVLEERLLFLVIKDPGNIKGLKKEDMGLFSQETAEIFAGLKEVDLDFAKLKSLLSTSCLERLNVVCLEAEVMDEDDCQEEFKKCLQRIRSSNIKKQLQEISDHIRQAEQKKEFQQVKSLAEEFNNLAKKLQE